MGWTRVGMLIVLACACAPDSGESEIDCDAAAVPLLPLEDDEDAYLAGRADDDWVFEVRTWPSDLDDIAAGGEAMLPIAHRVVTVSGCGDEVRVLGESLESLQAPPRADMPWIARTSRNREPQGLWLVDPHADAPLVRLTHRVEDFVRTDSGVIVVDGNGTDRTWLARVEIDDGAPVKTVEREGIRQIADAFDSSLVHERVAFVTEAGDLVVRELASGSERLVRPAVTGARVLDASGDRFYFTTEVAPSGVVIDDEAGIEIPLLTGGGVEGIGSVSVGVGPTWVEARVFEAGEVVESQHVFLPDLRELRQPGSWACLDCARRDSDVILMRGPLGLYRVDPESDTPVFVRETGGYALLVDDRIRLFDVVAVEPPAFAVSTYRVLDMALDGTDVHDVLEENVNDMLRMADGRWAYVRKVGPLGYGEVVVFDEETGERRVVVDAAGAYLAFLNWRLVGEEDSGRLLYHQRGDEEPHGIWLVHVDRLLE